MIDTFIVKPESYSEESENLIKKITQVVKNYRTNYLIIDEDQIGNIKESDLYIFLDKSQKFNVILPHKAKILCFTDQKRQENDNLKNLSFYNTDLGSEALMELLDNFLEKLKQPLSDKLDSVLVNLISELQQIKEIHKKIVPIRELNLKNIISTSKYSPGLKSGGDFYEYIQGDSEVIVLLLSSKNYVVSSLVMTLHEEFRKNTIFTKEKILEFVGGIFKTLSDENITDPADFPHLTILSVDPVSLCVEGINLGNIEIVTESNYHYGAPLEFIKDNFEEKYFKFKLKRGEKIVFLTPGVRSNTHGKVGNDDLIKMIQDKLDYNSRELLDEIFFQLKKDMNEGDFLDFDSTVIVLEADKKALLEV